MTTPSTSRKPQKPYSTGFEGRRWILHGLIWGALMFGFMGILFKMAEKEPITLRSALLDLALWLVSGLAYGLTMKGYFGWQAKRKAARESKAEKPS